MHKVANKRSEEFNTTHTLQTFRVREFVLLKAHKDGKTEHNTATRFFQLYNGLYTLCKKVGKNTYIVGDEQINKVISKFQALSLQKYFQH